MLDAVYHLMIYIYMVLNGLNGIIIATNHIVLLFLLVGTITMTKLNS